MRMLVVCIIQPLNTRLTTRLVVFSPLQPAITACGLWRRRRRTPSGCWGRAPWCCLTRSSAASGKTCTSSVPAARYGVIGRDCGLPGVADSFIASGQALSKAFCPKMGSCLSPFRIAKELGLRDRSGRGHSGAQEPFSCCCSQRRALCPSL